MLFRTPPSRPDDIRQRGDDAHDALLSRTTVRHTLGSIIWMAMLRLTLAIFLVWYLKDYFATYSEWWMITVGVIYGIAIYPAQVQYHYFKKASRRLVENTLCSSCRYFNADGLHCTQLDEHVTEHYLPCEGEGWEPTSFEYERDGEL